MQANVEMKIQIEECGYGIEDLDTSTSYYVPSKAS